MLRGLLAGLCTALCALVVGSPPAVADPAVADPPPDPGLIGPAIDAEAPPAPPPPLDPFTAASVASKESPGGTLVALLGGNHPVDAVNQSVGLSAPPPTDPLAATNILMPQYYRMPSGEAASPYVLQTDAPAGPFQRIDAWKGVHALAHGSLGRMPRDELSQPLPGTAPPPGTNIPAGLEQYCIVPELPLPPAAPAG